MATLHHDHAGHSLIYVKGAPEEVLAMCSHQRSQGEDHLIQLDFWHAKISEASVTGQRILAMASRAVQAKQQTLEFSDVKTGFLCLDWSELWILRAKKLLPPCSNAMRQEFASK